TSSPPRSTLFPYTTLFRSHQKMGSSIRRDECTHPVSDRRNNRLRRSQRLAEFLISNDNENLGVDIGRVNHRRGIRGERELVDGRSEEHTSELQSLAYLVCR